MFVCARLQLGDSRMGSWENLHPDPDILSPGQTSATSMSAQLQQSSFGAFQKAMAEFSQHIDTRQFVLPSIIVIGEQSVGKSSLLEAISKCPVFPRDRKLATQAPVRLQLDGSDTASIYQIIHAGQTETLQAKHQIIDAMTKIMQSKTAVSMEEVVVRIVEPGLPTLELLDLPGIRATPEEDRQMTGALAKKHLSSPDCLVLCVLSAATDAIVSSQAVQMIQEAGKQNQTLLVLTKADTVSGEDVRPYIVDRVLGRSGSMDILGLADLSGDENFTEIENTAQACESAKPNPHPDPDANPDPTSKPTSKPSFAGCLAVVDRRHNSSLTLQQAQWAEQQQFTQLLMSESVDLSRLDHQAAAAQVGVSNVILKLDALFARHIATSWKPRALQHLREMHADLAEASAQLGLEPGLLSAVLVRQHLHEQMSYDYLFFILMTIPIPIKLEGEWMGRWGDPPSDEDLIGTMHHQASAPLWTMCGLTDLFHLAMQPASAAANSAASCLQLGRLVEALRAQINAWLQKAEYMEIAAHALQLAASSQVLPVLLHRLPDLPRALINSLQRIINQQEIAEAVEAAINPHLALLSAGQAAANSDFGIQLAENVQTTIAHHLLQAIMNGPFAGFFDEECIFHESEEYAQERARPARQGACLRSAVELILLKGKVFCHILPA